MTSRFDTLADETAAPLSRGWMIIALNVYLLAVLTALPVAQVPLPQLPQTATVYASGLTVTEASTAFLLFNLALPIQSRTVLLLGCAYLFAAAMAVLHLLSYPGAL